MPLLPVAALPTPARARAPREFLKGSSKGPLKKEAWLASGAFGCVCRCSDAAGELFAVKCVARGAAGAIGELTCLQENVKHPNLGDVQEAFWTRLGLCLRLSFVAGEELFHMAGSLAATQALSVAVGLALALSHLHRRGYVHRDCKPENVLVDGHKAPLVDFGSLRSVGSWAAVEGARAYMAPEALNAKAHRVLAPLDARGPGVTLCVAFSGNEVKTMGDASREASRAKPEFVALTQSAAALVIADAANRPTISSFQVLLWELGGC